jgi:hypothetical protein
MVAGAGCAVRVVTYRTKRLAGHALAVKEDSTTRSQWHLEGGRTRSRRRENNGALLL